jgi:hypothetical protein
MSSRFAYALQKQMSILMGYSDRCAASSMQSNSFVLLINYGSNWMPSLVVTLRRFATRVDARGISTLSQAF